MRELIQRLFPQLEAFEITSPRDGRYNCIAWAAGDTTRWWWPGEPQFSFWPAGVRREESIGSFIEAFATLGFEPSDSGNHHAAFEKVAIFASRDDVPTHMARQLPDGSWTSKLGGLEDIAHVDVTGVAGSDYGAVVVFLHRRK
ncbi:MAG TPA: hypothetical protein VEK57_15300 [Thermoanaerobaculia bacterium]|nr:hypothetical protein [Thermoanaerobaculia bacterium]